MATVLNARFNKYMEKNFPKAEKYKKHAEKTRAIYSWQHS